MIKRILLLVLFGCALVGFSWEPITVWRNGKEFFVRSTWSATHDLVIRNFRYANEAAYLISKDTPISEAVNGMVLHINLDEYPATWVGGFGFLSGNHGSVAARMLEIQEHGLDVRDIGGKVTEADGTTYIIMDIPDSNRILIHPEGKNNSLDPDFRAHSIAKLFYQGRDLAFRSSTVTQLYPLNRITDWTLLADGMTLVPDKTEIKCKFVDFVFNHDVIFPYAAVQLVKNNPGKLPVPRWTGTWGTMCYVDTPALKTHYADYMKLPTMMSYHNRLRYEARGAVVNTRTAVYHMPLRDVQSMDVMFGWENAGEIGKQKREEFYIPKLKPVTVKGIRGGKVLACDFSKIYLMPSPMSVYMNLMRRDCLDPADPPDRFIRIVGWRRREYGIAVGYSLFLGCTAKAGGSPYRDILYQLYDSKKIYPYAYNLPNAAPGTTMETVVYKQYFNPRLEPDATSFYCHHQGISLIVYLDFHKALKNKLILLPAEATGKKITILEKTQSVILQSNDTVSAEGLRLEVNDKYGYLVLKLD